MPITRRQFLERLAAVSVVSSIAPAFLSEAAKAVEGIGVPQIPATIYPALTLAKLEEAFMACTYGYAEPDLIVMSPDSYAEFVPLWEKLPQSGRFLIGDPPEISCPYFEGVPVSYSKALKPGTVMMINSAPPAERPEEYSGLFRRRNHWLRENIPSDCNEP